MSACTRAITCSRRGAQRLKLAWTAWKLVRGRGELPRLHPKFPVATFEQLEEPLGLLDASLYQPFVRFIETTSESWSYAPGQPQWLVGRREPAATGDHLSGWPVAPPLGQLPAARRRWPTCSTSSRPSTAAKATPRWPAAKQRHRLHVLRDARRTAPAGGMVRQVGGRSER